MGSSAVYLQISAFLIVVIIAAEVGCNRDSAKVISQEPLLAIWQSTNATPMELMEAANKYIPIGADGETVKNLLGASNGWKQVQITTRGVKEKMAGNRNEFQLIFPQSANAAVILIFDAVTNAPSAKMRFEHAIYTISKTTLHSTSTIIFNGHR